MDVAQLVRDVVGRDVGEVVERTGGQLSTVYEVRTSADPVIVKVYAPEWLWKQAKEVHVYGMLEQELAGSIPRVMHVGDGVTMLSKIDGVPLSEAEPPDWRAMYVQLGDLLRRVHRIPQPEYGYLTDQILDPLPDNDQYMRRQFAKKLHEFEQLGGDLELHAKITAHVEQNKHLFADNTAAALCHNDFHEGNILVDPTTWRVNGFIDVENAIAADPLIDLAKTIQYSAHDNPEKLAGLTDGYGAVPADRIDLYRLYHSLELWDWFQSIGETTYLDSIAQDLAKLVER
ncbi:phosphotransferase family protein [Kribbella speibonae]|uniref:Aminoglycoside phosphotransferase family protein n=1 Tax=Kribbella speibonae TaxID=1572660 RepID=A0A4R0J492_9ACTN|nr:aminoglycoside phosphotransferase family protein [Kribbella speibonae]TCC40300.1 aminoglycoside phosphotransferase family protein [Kribbella speibonae]